MTDTERIRREVMRWQIILTLNNGRPEAVSEELILRTVQDITFQDATALEVRRELDYLEARRLVSLQKRPSGRWWAELTRYGIDMAEYTIDCEPGIARPVKYWG